MRNSALKHGVCILHDNIVPLIENITHSTHHTCVSHRQTTDGYTTATCQQHPYFLVSGETLSYRHCVCGNEWRTVLKVTDTNAAPAFSGCDQYIQHHLLTDPLGVLSKCGRFIHNDGVSSFTRGTIRAKFATHSTELLQ